MEHFNTLGSVLACLRQHLGNRVHTESPVSHYKAFWPSRSFSNKGSECGDLFVLNWPRGAVASVLCDNIYSILPLGLFQFFLESSCKINVPAASEQQRRAQEQTNREGRGGNRHGGVAGGNTEIMTFFLWPSSHSAGCKQQLSDFPLSPLAPKCCFHLPLTNTANRTDKQRDVRWGGDTKQTERLL